MLMTTRSLTRCSVLEWGGDRTAGCRTADAARWPSVQHQLSLGYGVDMWGPMLGLHMAHGTAGTWHCWHCSHMLVFTIIPWNVLNWQIIPEDSYISRQTKLEPHRGRKSLFSLASMRQGATPADPGVRGHGGRGWPQLKAGARGQAEWPQLNTGHICLAGIWARGKSKNLHFWMISLMFLNSSGLNIFLNT